MSFNKHNKYLKKFIACSLTILLVSNQYLASFAEIQQDLLNENSTIEKIETISPETSIEEHIHTTETNEIQNATNIGEEFSSENLENINDPIIDVTLPTECPFTIDPYEINGKGQIYSDDIYVINSSNIDILVTLESIRYVLKDKENCNSLDEPFDSNEIYSDNKDIFMFMRRGIISESGSLFSQDTNNILDDDVIITSKKKKEAMSFILSSYNCSDNSNMAVFQFFGLVNPNPEIPWNNGDIVVKMVFSFEPMIPIEYDETFASTTEIVNDEVLENPTEKVDNDEEMETTTGIIENNTMETTTEIIENDTMETTTEMMENGMEEVTTEITDNDILYSTTEIDIIQ